MKAQLSDHFTYKKLIKFTLPSITMMIFTSIYTIVDGLFVSNVVGSNAFASVNLIYPFISILGAFGFMIGTGGSALVSKTLGEKDYKKANRYFSMLICFTIIIGLLLSIFGIAFIRPISKMLGADETTLEGCILYGRIMIVGIIPFMLQNAFQSFLIVAEKQNLGLTISIIAGICNIIGDFLLVYVLKLGLIGAGIATVFSQCIGATIPLIYFIKKNKSKLKLELTKFELKPIIKTCSNGISEMLSSISMSIVSMLYNIQLMKQVGSDGVVAYGIIMYIAFVFVAIFLGYSLGTAPIIGYNYGAENKKELKNIFKKSGIVICICGVTMMILAEVSSSILARIFVSYDENLMQFTTNAIRLYAVAFLFNGFNIFTSSFFTALNNGVVSAIISFFRTFAFQVIMVLVLPMFFGVNGIWTSVVVAEILSLIISGTFVVLNRKKYGYI